MNYVKSEDCFTWYYSGILSIIKSKCGKSIEWTFHYLNSIVSIVLYSKFNVSIFTLKEYSLKNIFQIKSDFEANDWNDKTFFQTDEI